MHTVKLDTLRIEEISGVDDPANQLPGWMVTKARGGGKRFIAGVLQKSGAITLLFGDGKDPEPVQDVARALLDCGVQKEAVDALVQRTAVSTAKRRAREHTHESLLTLADNLRKSVHEAGYTDAAFVALISDGAIAWTGHNFAGILKAHDRRHQETGKYISGSTPTTGLMVHGADGVAWHSTGAIHPVMRALAQGAKGIPVQTGDEARQELERRRKEAFDAEMAAMAAESNL